VILSLFTTGSPATAFKASSFATSTTVCVERNPMEMKPFSVTSLGLLFSPKRPTFLLSLPKKKLSLETAAREARHSFFNECSGHTGVSKILLAHHADDQAETILFNLLRGSSGIKGMSTRQKIGELTFLRPLLKVRRSEIDSFLANGNHPFREDSSNSKPFATRNRLRHEAFPLLSDILERDPVPALLRAHQRTEELEQIANAQLKTFNILDPKGRIHLPIFRTLSPALQKKALHQYLTENNIPNISSNLISRGLTLLSPDSPSSINLPGSQRLRRKESRLFISS
jgi:tRNA(Ile)-lysidine synthase